MHSLQNDLAHCVKSGIIGSIPDLIESNEVALKTVHFLSFLVSSCLQPYELNHHHITVSLTLFYRTSCSSRMQWAMMNAPASRSWAALWRRRAPLYCCTGSSRRARLPRRPLCSPAMTTNTSVSKSFSFSSAKRKSFWAYLQSLTLPVTGAILTFAQSLNSYVLGRACEVLVTSY